MAIATCKFRATYIDKGKIGKLCTHTELCGKEVKNVEQGLRITCSLVCSECEYREPTKDKPIIMR